MSDQQYTVRDVPLGFAPVPPELVLWTDSGGKPLTGTEMRVWAMLAMHRDLMTQKTSAGVIRMSKMLGVDRTTIQRAVNRLMAAGFLLHQPRRRDPETGTFRPAIFTLAVNGKPLRLGVVTDHDASMHNHEASHDAHHDASVHTKREYKESKREHAPNGALGEPNSGEFVAFISEALKHKTVPLDETYKLRLGRDVKAQLRKGTPEDVLWEWLDHIVERWDDYQCSLRQAASDVANGKPSKHAKLPVGRASDVNHNGMTRKEREADRRRQMQEVGIASIDEPGEKRDLDAELKKMREAS